MKKFGFLIFGVFIMALISCGDDNNDVGNIINYDGENASSPILPGGEHATAIHLPASVMGDFEGRIIKNVRVFVYEVPENLTLSISDGASSTQPGSVIYERSFIGLIRDNSWNIHAMAEDITLDGSALWFNMKFSHSDTQQTIGCDAGPSQSGGDWLNMDEDGEWRTFQDRTGESINWNIRIELDE